MAKTDLSGYTLSELKVLQHEVERTIKDRQQQGVQKAREQILAVASKAGVSVEELLGNGGTKAKKANGRKVEAEYQNPKDTSQTWTGLGRSTPSASIPHGAPALTKLSSSSRG